ncbi:hypothetical protein [Kordia sp.]|uniref:hypothetical protein n=1 Tax=Kordia sp. TaxID=1965332 RepID=UPI003D27B053
MNSKIETLLQEMITYKANRKSTETDIYIKKAFEKIEEEILYVSILNLLNWIDPKFHTPGINLEKYLLYEDFMDPEDFEEIHKEFKLLFKYIPELKEIFALKEKYIEFNTSLTKGDIQEIYEYVNVNKIVNPESITRYYDYPKDK